MIHWFLRLIGVSRHYSLEREVGRLTKMVDVRRKESQAMTRENELIATISNLRKELGIGGK